MSAIDVIELDWSSACDADLYRAPWVKDQAYGYGPGASATDPLLTAPTPQSAPPAYYAEAAPEELDERIDSARKKLGDKLLTLGHFYQRDEIIEHTDAVGDSFQLARIAADAKEVETIVFCGVKFMGETSDILTRADQRVILPNMAAGCSMADMANDIQVSTCWEELTEIVGTRSNSEGKVPLVPVTYMNSSVQVKAFCGTHGGIVCTSSNAPKVLEWCFEHGQRVLFVPDANLGSNTALAMGILPEQLVTWKPYLHYGGLTEEQISHSKVIVWDGFCSVHKRFTIEQIAAARRKFPNVRVIVHPECVPEVVQAADGYGSTDYLLKQILHAKEPTTFAVGTEINMVRRLARQHPEHHIFCLDPVVCPCSTMYRIHPAYLAWSLDRLVAGDFTNQIVVETEFAEPARLALKRMLEVKP